MKPKSPPSAGFLCLYAFTYTHTALRTVYPYVYPFRYSEPEGYKNETLPD